MDVITIPKQLVKKGELVLIPRSDYEEFLDWQKSVKTFKPTAAEKRALREARKDFSRAYGLKKKIDKELLSLVGKGIYIPRKLEKASIRVYLKTKY